MSYPYTVVNVAGYAVLGATTAGSGALWLAGQVADAPSGLVNAAGNNALTACILTIAAMAVNGWMADRKSRRESDERTATAVHTTEHKVAEALVVADRKLLDAKAEADHRIATLEARLAVADRQAEEATHARHEKMDQLYTLMNRLFVHASEHGNAINALIPAVQENSARTGTPAPDVAPVESPMGSAINTNYS